MRIAFVGLGSDLYSDDIAGVFAVNKLRSVLPKHERFMFFELGVAPENFVEPICRFSPDLLLLFDAVDMNVPPGTIMCIDASHLGDGKLSSHSSRLQLLLDYWQSEMPVRIVVVGIQPQQMDFDGELSNTVLQNISVLVETIKQWDLR